MLSRIDSLAKKVLSQNVSSNGQLDYSQLAQMNKQKLSLVNFCDTMAELLYSGEKITAQESKALLMNLENVMRDEGKLVLIEHRHEEIEKERFFFDKWIENVAKKISGKINFIPKKEETEEQNNEEEPEEVEKKEEKEVEVDPRKELEKISTKIVPVKSKKIEKKKEKEEYRYIESLDVLDRIENKLKARQASKITKN